MESDNNTSNDKVKRRKRVNKNLIGIIIGIIIVVIIVVTCIIIFTNEEKR